MKVIKFTLKSPFAFFKNKENISENYSFVFITKMNVIGGLAAIIGLNGFHKYSKTYHKCKNEIENCNKNISKLKIENLKENVLNSIDKLIETNTNKNLTQQNELLNEFKNNIDELNEDIVLNNNLENHLKKYNEAKNNIFIFNKNIEELELELEQNQIEYRCLFENKISIISKKDVNYTKVTFNDSTLLNISNIKNRMSNITEHILSDVEYDIYYELKDNAFDKKIEDYLINNKSVYDFYLGKNQFVADISNVEVLDLENVNSNEIKELKTISLIDNSFIDKMDINGIKINMPINNLKNGIYSDYKMLIDGKYILDSTIDTKNLYKIDKNILYFI